MIHQLFGCKLSIFWDCLPYLAEAAEAMMGRAQRGAARTVIPKDASGGGTATSTTC